MIVTKGAVDVSTYVMLVDSVTGAPETGYTITDLDLQYTRNQSTPAAKVDATALAATNSVHSDNKAIQIDATSSPGLYRIDWPDAAFASGADKVMLVVTGSGLAPAVLLVELVNYDTQDGVRMGLTALPNAAADAAGGLPISDAGGLDLDTLLGRVDVAVSTRLAAAGYTAPLDAAGTRAAVGLAAANLDAQLSAIDDLIDTEVALILSRLGIPAGASIAADIDALPTAVENADALLGRTLSGGASGGRMVKDALRVLRNKTDIAAGTLTVYEEDDATPAFTAAVTTAAGNPISSIDPS